MILSIFNQNLIEQSARSNVDPAQTPHFAVSGLGLHCCLVSRRICVKLHISGILIHFFSSNLY